MAKKTLLKISNLKKYYHSSIKAVDGVDIEVYEGETFGLVGESGCGKSTVGNMLVNLIDSTEGEVIYNNRNIFGIKPREQRELRKDMQIIFQDPYSSLNPKKKIGWLLEEPLIIHGIGNKVKRQEAVERMLQTVGMDKSYAKSYCHELSGGQRQRISIAIALMLQPKFIVADEAVSALDVSIQSQILNLLKSLQKEMGLTYLFISHDLNVIQYMSDRIGVMYLGKIVEQGNVEEIYEEPLHPYTQALLSAIPDIAGRKKERIVLGGDVPSPANPPKGCAFHTRCHRAEPICKEKMPELKEISPTRKVRCHFVL